MIDQATIERIQSVAQITDVVSDFVTLRKRGINYVGLCPFHDDKSPSFYVSPAKNICKCFSCGEGGTPIHFVMKHEQFSYTDALKYLAKKYGIEVKEKELTEEQKQVQGDRESMFILNGFAQKTFESNLFNHLEGKSVGLSYFLERGFREDIISKFHLGYALEQKDAFTQEALKSGYKKTYLEKTGLTIVGEGNYMVDRFRGRVIFPVHSLSGKVVAFGGRILKTAEKTAKYVNSPESEIYHKGSELYGLYLARQAMVKHDKCFLVEGYTDVISMHQAGIENVVASSGTALTIGQIRLIHRFTNNITVLYDGDAAGIKAALRGIDLLLEEGMNIKVVLLPEGEDPDSFARKQNATSLIEFINAHETDFVRFKTNLLIKDAGDDPIKKAHLINEIVDTISIIPEEIVRLVYVKECSKLLDMDERALLRAIAKKRKEAVEKKTTAGNKSEQTESNQNTTIPLNETASSLTPGNITDNIPVNTPATYLLDKFEQGLLRYIVRYGERVLYVSENEETKEQIPVTVAEYIYQDLTQDDLALENPVFKQMLNEVLEKLNQPDFVAERYFLNHSNPEISQLAVKFVSDKYSLSKVHSKFQKIEEESERLMELVPYEVLNYKDAILKQQMETLNARIKSAQDNNDFEEMKNLMSELSSLWQESKKIISKHLGERIVLKI
ncbi:MAG: DNA primase [Dysgonamonadaceae bacterium]|jgi:DNA primase|nr:DNA primase [Dysgonamonadaceae bacterium]